ncbi:MAG: DUF190 domain-containing protein [Mariprofundaceae bacterium]
MKKGMLLRIYLTESDQVDDSPAMDAILALCKEAGLKGVTVTRGIEGLGEHGVHSTSFLSLASDLPLIVEAIDTPAIIEAATELIRPHLGHRTLATWPVSVMRTDEGSNP